MSMMKHKAGQYYNFVYLFNSKGSYGFSTPTKKGDIKRFKLEGFDPGESKNLAQDRYDNAIPYLLENKSIGPNNYPLIVGGPSYNDYPFAKSSGGSVITHPTLRSPSPQIPGADKLLSNKSRTDLPYVSETFASLGMPDYGRFRTVDILGTNKPAHVFNFTGNPYYGADYENKIPKSTDISGVSWRRTFSFGSLDPLNFDFQYHWHISLNPFNPFASVDPTQQNLSIKLAAPLQAFEPFQEHAHANLTKWASTPIKDPRFVFAQFRLAHVHRVQRSQVNNDWENIVETTTAGFDKLKDSYSTDLDLLNSSVNHYFSSWNWTLFTDDSSTSYGVPYDFQTLLYGDVDVESIGVNTKQPSYEKIYNYYDAEYEPSVSRMIKEDALHGSDASLLDEKILPSIYDFLYLEDQPELAFFLKPAGLKLKETNLAAFNRFADSIGKTYDQAVGDNVTLHTLGKFTDSELPYEFKIGGPKGVHWTPHKIRSDAFKKIKKVMTKHYQDDGSLSDEAEAVIDLIKTKSNPIWLGEMKMGTYFSEKSYERFNQALNKDFVFPFLMKVNIPQETQGPIATLLKENDLLDQFNLGSAAKTIPQLEYGMVEGAFKEYISKYSNFNGTVLNGKDGASTQLNQNLLYDLKLKNLRIFFNDQEELTAIPLEDAGNELPLPQFDDEISDEVKHASNPNWFVMTEDMLKFLKGVVVGITQLPTGLFPSIEGWKSTHPEGWADDPTNYVWLEGSPIHNVHAYRSILESAADKTNYDFLWKNIFSPIGMEYEGNPEYKKLLIDLFHEATKIIDLYLNDEYYYKMPYDQLVTILEADDAFISGNFWKSQQVGLSTDIIEESIKEIEKLFNANANKAAAVQPDPGTIKDPDYEPHLKEMKDHYYSKVAPLMLKGDYEFDEFIKTSGTPLTATTQILTYEGKSDSFASNSPFSQLINKIKGDLFRQKMLELFRDDGLLRSPEDIANGKLAHQETLMYEIVKYRIEDDGAERYIQSIFLPISEQNQISYYDTQVIPEQKYFYKIFAHKVIVGTRYRPRPLEYKYAGKKAPLFLYNGNPQQPVQIPSHDGSFDSANGVIIALLYEAHPYLQITRVPYYNSKTVNIATDMLNHSIITDKPPLPPQISFVPYRGINNKIMILLENSLGEVDQYPRMIFEEAEKPLLDEIYLNQDKVFGEKISYKSDDAQGTFQIYRLEALPESFTSFAETPIEGYTELLSLGELKDDSFIDFIRPNKDYYYIARFQDLHGKLSNPTEVTKLRMIANDGVLPFLTTELIDIKEMQKKAFNENFSAVKKMQKYLYIQPNYLQTSVFADDEDTLEDENYISYPTEKLIAGSSADGETTNVFGKKFKFRITSKQTGKKLDINLTVKELAEITNNE